MAADPLKVAELKFAREVSVQPIRTIYGATLVIDDCEPLQDERKRVTCRHVSLIN
jgi:hypothetical protein